MDKGNNKIVAMIQARMSSARLPGKVLKSILGKPMLGLMIERVRRVQNIDELVVATSDHFSDDYIEKFCTEYGVDCFRGSLNDVLDRFYQAASIYNADHIVRLTGDCPLADPELIEQVIEHHLTGKFDISGSGACDSYPDGLDVEVVTFAALKKTWQEAELPSEREHLTSHMIHHPETYRCGVVHNTEKLGHLRWSVDEPEDFLLVTRIYEALYPNKPDFTTGDILAFLTIHPDLIKINCHITMNEGYQKSLQEDQEYLQQK